ncbi:hypothetical protein GCM10010269_34050 [Streptomyces humidus]|uniref:Uncharacterized protein n=1 Tax=Streptomyces humidus TaxID=52259 RepID=A0A918L490_9ACTN|nr:hypothetical protein GCM10010269_34050 [Streptomyces humidus]
MFPPPGSRGGGRRRTPMPHVGHPGTRRESSPGCYRGPQIHPGRCDTHSFKGTGDPPQPPPPNSQRRNHPTHPELRKQALPETPSWDGETPSSPLGRPPARTESAATGLTVVIRTTR